MEMLATPSLIASPTEVKLWPSRVVVEQMAHWNTKITVGQRHREVVGDKR
jgi:hypothetical protein